MRSSNFSPLALSTPVITLVVVSPLIAIFGSAVTTESIALLKHLVDTVIGTYVTNSLLLMLGVGSLTLIIGVPTAWLTSICEFPGRKVFVWALLLPLAFPAYIIAYTYTGLLDYFGPVYTLVRHIVGEERFADLYVSIRSLPGAIVLFALVLYPYVYLLSRISFLEQSSGFIELSRTLGYSMGESFFKVAVPLTRPAIVAGVSLALMETLADYGTVQFFGIDTFTTGIIRAFGSYGDASVAAQLSIMLLGFVGLLMFCEWFSRRKVQYHSAKGKTIHQSKIRLVGKKALLAWLACFLPVLLGFLLPALILLKWTLFDAEYDLSRFAVLVWNTVRLGATAAAIAVILSVVLGYAKRTVSTRVVASMVAVSGLGYAIPGAIIAVGVITPLVWLDLRLIDLFRSALDIEVGLILSGSIFALLFAYTVRFLAISLNAVQTGLQRIRPSMDYSARVLGCRPWEVLKRVHLPVMRASLITAFLIVFVDVLKELPATLILRPFNFNTLAVRAYELASDERLIDAALPSLTIVLTGIVPVIILSKTMTRERR
ncbi:MAG: iron ABC transporter permease [Acidiferrobacterales bacterium]|nr:iron ABC transporter permease [Acidiferrobacterales bacterium]